MFTLISQARKKKDKNDNQLPSAGELESHRPRIPTWQFTLQS